MLLYETVKRKL